MNSTTKRAAALAATFVLSVGVVGAVSSPAIARGCDQLATSTSLALGDAVVAFGEQPTVSAEVTSLFGTPDGGFVQFIADGPPFASPVLDMGHASATMPVLAVGTYGVGADYDGFCGWAGSGSDSHAYTVKKARVVIDPRVRNAALAKFAADFIGSGGVDPGTAPFQDDVDARFKVVKRSTGAVVRNVTTTVSDGVAKVDVADLRPGRYRLDVTFLGTDNFRSAAAEKRFRVQ